MTKTNKAVLIGGLMLCSLTFFGTSLIKQGEWQEAAVRKYEIPPSEAKAFLHERTTPEMSYDPTKRYTLETSVMIIHKKTSLITYATRVDTTSAIVRSEKIPN
jgi:hypothetical protein